MKNEITVPKAVIKRLPKYYIYLENIAEKGIIRVSSKELSEITGLTASQIRQDLNHFGGFGQQGYGYNVLELKKELEKILGLNKSYDTIMIGYGNIGKAIYRYKGFKRSGLNIVAIFDKDESLIGKEIDGIKIQNIDNLNNFLEKNKSVVAVMAIPENSAKEICDILVKNDIKAIWNFASIDLKLPKSIVIENVHLDESLYTLTYYINNIKDYKGR